MVKKVKITIFFNNYKHFYTYVFFSLTDRLTDKLLIYQMLINQRKLHKKKNKSSIFNSSLENHVFVIFLFCHLQPDQQTDEQNIYRIDAHREGKPVPKRIRPLILNTSRENHVLVFLHLCLLQLDGHIIHKINGIIKTNLHKKRIRPLS